MGGVGEALSPRKDAIRGEGASPVIRMVLELTTLGT